VTENWGQAAAFIAGGGVAGTGVSAAVGGMGLAGGFGAVGISTVPVVGAGAVVGAAAYGAFQAIGKGDTTALGAMGIDAIGGAGTSSIIGGMGLVAPKIGLAFGISTAPMAAAGAVVGLAAYGVAKLLDESGTGETPSQVFLRMEEKVSWQETYTQVLLELELASLDNSLADYTLQQKFTALEIEEELQALKAELQQKKNNLSQNHLSTNFSNARLPHQPAAIKIAAELVSLKPQLPETWKCVHTLNGHSAAVNSISISADGQTFVSGSDDKTVSLWELKTGRWLYTFFGQAAVLSVAISPDNQNLASASINQKIDSYNLDTKAYLNTFLYSDSPHSHSGFVYSLAFSRDGKILASSADKIIRLWRQCNRKVMHTLNGHEAAVLIITISPDSKTLASGSADRTIRLWDLSSWGHPRILTGHSDVVNSITISSDGQILVSGSTDSTIKLWNFHTGELLHTWTAHASAVLSVAISPDGETLASSSTDGIIIWHLSRGELLQNLSGRNPVAFSPDGKTLVSGGNSGSIKIWHQMQGFDKSKLDPKFSPKR